MSETPPTKIYDEFLFNTTTHLLKPLQEILTSGEKMAEGTGKDDPKSSLAHEILAQAHTLLDMVNDLRDYAEIQTGRILIEKQPVDMNQLVQEVLGIAAWLVKSKPAISLQTDIPASLPPLTVQKVRIQQVLINLIHNAVKFTEAGSIKLAAEVSASQVTFQVKDTGPGIAADKFPLVLAPFQTAFENPADERVGLGLGLPICKYIVEAHGGALWFESTAGQGTTFYFSLPVTSPTE